MSGIIGKKVGMTSIFDAEGKNIPCTVIEAGPCVVTQLRTVDTDGYTAVQLAFDDKKEKNTSGPLKGHFTKAKTTPKRKLVEFKNFEDAKALGDIVSVEIFAEGDYVDVVGTSKGKGFQGVVKRHGFGGVGGAGSGAWAPGGNPGGSTYGDFNQLSLDLMDRNMEVMKLTEQLKGTSSNIDLKFYNLKKKFKDL